MRIARISTLITAGAALIAALVVPAAFAAGATAKSTAATAAHARAGATTKPNATPKKPVKIAFLGSYSGQASSKVDGNTAALAANGNGTGTKIGAGTITGTGTADSSVQPCPPFAGSGTIKAAKGTIRFTVVSGSKGCGDEGGHTFSLSGYLLVTRATGALAKKKGKLKLTGVYDRDGGTFQIKLRGTLK